ncbi:MAG: ABC transporter permease subunit [Romboutsia sp.]
MKEYTLLKSRVKIKKNRQKIFNSIYKNDKIEVALSCATLLFLWQIIALKINNDIYLPTIGQVLSSLGKVVVTQKFYLDVISSIGRCIVSFFIAIALAIIIGMLAYISRKFRNFLKPINSIAQSIPTMVLIVLALIWFDKDNASIIVGFAIVFPILYDSVLSAMIGLDKRILEMATLYKVSLKNRILKIYFPAIKIQIVQILVSTYSLALKVVIAGEVYSQPKYGMGAMIQVEKMNFNTPGIFAWLVIIVAISMVLDVLQKILVRRVSVWKI